MLLLKSTSDGAAGTSKTQEVLQEKLEEIATELKNAKAQAATPQPVKEKFDRYEKGSEQADSPGLYQIQKDEGKNYKILFSPYEEQQ